LRHGIWKCLVVTIVAVAGLSRPAAAQTSEEPRVGHRIRIGLPDTVRFSPFVRPGIWVAGTLVRATPDSLVLHVGGDNPLFVARRNITALEVSEGRSHWRSAVTHALFGGAVSASATYIVDHAEGSVQGRRVAIAAGTGLAFGALLGALSPSEHWGKPGR